MQLEVDAAMRVIYALIGAIDASVGAIYASGTVLRSFR